MSALLAAAVFLILATTLLGQFAHQYAGERHQQQVIQARWNARSGLDLYLHSGQASPPQTLELPHGQRCQVEQQGQDLVFEGLCGSAQVNLTCPGGDPARAFETVVAR